MKENKDNSKAERVSWAKDYLSYFLKWVVLSVIIGIACGLTGAAFEHCLAYVTALRQSHAWLILLLPAAGLLIVFIYRGFRISGVGTNQVFDSVVQGGSLKLRLMPAIFISTALTHLCGGSAGRESAALQLGGNLGCHIGRLLHFDKEDERIATMTGMAAFFAALFGTPVTAAVFIATVISVGMVRHAMLVPGMFASVLASQIAKRLGSEPVRFAIEVPDVSLSLMLRVMVLAIACGLVSALFVRALYWAGKGYDRLFSNPYIRVAVGGLCVIALTLLAGNQDYNGSGMNVIQRAILEGQSRPWDFALKILFTALTMEAGYKGGEIVPAFYIGATFGCAFGSLLGIPAGFAAAIGFVTVFGGVTNTMITSIILAVEVFGGAGLPYFAIACMLSFVFSGYNGLYSSQVIMFSKLRSSRIMAKVDHQMHLDNVGEGAIPENRDEGSDNLSH
ncbi:MAG: chloride channel protein [Eubacterium sp.]|nr:chloride channel protein [Eubacterium sp.]